MNNITEVVDLFENKVKTLLEKYNFLKEENDILYNKVAVLENQISEDKQVINGIEKNSRLKSFATQASSRPSIAQRSAWEQSLYEAEQKMFNISQEGTKESFTSMKTAVKDAWEMIEAIHENKLGTVSVQTGYFQLDDMQCLIPAHS